MLALAPLCTLLMCCYQVRYDAAAKFTDAGTNDKTIEVSCAACGCCKLWYLLILLTLYDQTRVRCYKLSTQLCLHATRRRVKWKLVTSLHALLMLCSGSHDESPLQGALDAQLKFILQPSALHWNVSPVDC